MLGTCLDLDFLQSSVKTVGEGLLQFLQTKQNRLKIKFSYNIDMSKSLRLPKK